MSLIKIRIGCYELNLYSVYVIMRYVVEIKRFEPIKAVCGCMFFIGLKSIKTKT